MTLRTTSFAVISRTFSSTPGRRENISFGAVKLFDFFLMFLDSLHIFEDKLEINVSILKLCALSERFIFSCWCANGDFREEMKESLPVTDNRERRAQPFSDLSL